MEPCLVNALKVAKTNDPEQIQKALKSLKKVPTVFGRLDYDSQNEVHPIYVILEVREGKLHDVDMITEY